jgi:hypothetical protein
MVRETVRPVTAHARLSDVTMRAHAQSPDA